MTGRIFVIFAAIAALVGLSGCNRQPVTEISYPDDAVVIATPFLAAVKRGDRAEAEKYIAPYFIDDSRLQFAKMSALLKKSPPLKAAIFQPKPGIMGPSKDEATIIFAAKEGRQWITSEMRLYRPEEGKFEIEYWDVKSDVKPPKLLTHAEQMRQFTTWFMGGLALMALVGLALLIWVVKRRTHIIAPEPAIETRRVAATVRDLEN